MRWNMKDRPMEAAPAPGGGGAPAQPTPEQLEIQRLRGALAQTQRPPQQQAGPPDKKQVETAFWQDPVGVSAAIASQAAQMASQNGPGLDTLIELAKKAARDDDPETFDKYYGEIEQSMTQANLGPQFRANVNVWRNAFNMVRGNHVNEIIETRSKGKASAAPSGDGPAASQPAAAPAAAKVKLSEDEAKMARNLGISEAGYIHGKRIIDEQHGREKSPWDDAITIDTASAQRAKRQARSAA